MSTAENGRYSLDYDPEFAEMLQKFKSAKFHSIEDSSSYEAFDSGTEDVDINDLNATFTAKTMENRRLSRVLDVLKDIESDVLLEEGMANMRIKSGKQLSTQYKKPQLPIPEIISPRTPSPCTPSNKIKPMPQRGHRLVPVNECELASTPRLIPKSNSKKRPHESNVTNSSAI